LGIFSFIMFLGFLFKRSAFALGFFFIWMIIESILYALIRWRFFDKEIADNISQFFPYTALKNLLPEPITRLSAAKNIGKQIGENIGQFEGVHTFSFLIVIGWIAFFVIISYKLLKRSDF